MSDQILLIEDDAKLAEMVKDYLGQSAYHVTIAKNGIEGLKLQANGNFDAVILDLMLPDIDGLEICKQMRATSSIPILMLTAKGDPMDRIVGLELGADDYMPKPFEPRELLARLRAILRRGSHNTTNTALKFGRLEINENALEARLAGKPCALTSHQFKLLSVLAKSPGRVLTRDFLMNHLTGDTLEAFDRSIDVHISRIRSEIEDDPKHPQRVITVRGAGYVFAVEQN